MQARWTVLMIASALVVAGCTTTSQPEVPFNYEAKAQNVRVMGKLDASDIAVGQVRVVNNLDLACGNRNLTIPGAVSSDDNAGNFANYWKKAFESELAKAGLLNEKNPKVKLYFLLDKVKIVGEPIRLQWMMNMTVFSSNGTILKNEVVYNAPTDNLRNMQEGCGRLEQYIDKAVAWSILKTVSSPAFPALVQPGLDYVPTMKAQSLSDSLTSIIKEPEQDDVWKKQPDK